ncbi:hypothetical protein ALC62_05180, partial [Cyphomyrmex costatus]
LRFAFTLNYFTLLLLLHTHISSISQKENHLSLRKSVKWRFTLKFVFRQIQEGRLR